MEKERSCREPGFVVEITEEGEIRRALIKADLVECMVDRSDKTLFVDARQTGTDYEDQEKTRGVGL